MDKRPGPKSEAQQEYMSVVGNQEPPITLYLHCKKAYDVMFANSREVFPDATTDEFNKAIVPDSMIVWEGMLTRLITLDLSLSIPYYTSITRALKNMGCIRQLRRGGGNSPSQWELITEPTEEKFNSVRPKKAPGKPDKFMMLQDQINNLSTRVLRLEDMLDRALRAAS